MPGASRRGVVVHFIAPPAGTSALRSGVRRPARSSPSPDVDAQRCRRRWDCSRCPSATPSSRSDRRCGSGSPVGPGGPTSASPRRRSTTRSSTPARCASTPTGRCSGRSRGRPGEPRGSTVYTPLVSGVGLGFPGLLSPATDVDIWWTANVVMVPSGATHTRRAGAAHLSTTNDVDTGVLTVRNDPADGTVSVTLRAAVHDRNPNGPGGELTQREAYFDVNGRSQGRGEDYQRSLDFLDHLNNPIPRARLDPRPDPGPLRGFGAICSSASSCSPSASGARRTVPPARRSTPQRPGRRAEVLSFGIDRCEAITTDRTRVRCAP